MRVLLLSILFLARAAAAAGDADIIIYGGTPGGLAAARAAVRGGASVIVVEPTSHIGGMITGGIAVTDTGTPWLVGGIAAEFFDHVAEIEKATTPSNSPTMLFQGRQLPWRAPARWDLEPKVARQVFEAWVKEDGYKLLTGKRLGSVEKSGPRITAIRLTDGSVLSGKVFIDASYEGDLMAAAGVSCTYGRESTKQYGEKLGGVREPHFIRNYTEEEYGTPTTAYMHHGQFGADLKARGKDGKLLWGVEAGPLGEVGSADRRLQAYCYRLIATQRSDLKLSWPKPDHYDPAHYELLLAYIRAHPGITFTRLVHLAAIPNGKWDLNASGPFSIDFVGGNHGYPDADWARRDRMLHEHVDYEQGFLWFLAHDPRLPPQLRGEVNSWGLAKDEWTDSGNWPTQLYIRESRRMIGAYVMTENDILRANTKQDSIGLGSFVLDSHWVRRFENTEGLVRVEGHLDESINLAAHPYEISYRSLTPKEQECGNLLVPVCLSASHVAICTIRMEPVYMILGHSAGLAAVMALQSGKPVQQIDVAALTQKLIRQKQVLHKEQRRFP